MPETQPGATELGVTWRAEEAGGLPDDLGGRTARGGH